MSRTPLQPIITCESSAALRQCSCCQGTNRVVYISFGWVEWPEDVKQPHGGSTRIALCARCRMEAADLLSRYRAADEASLQEEES